MKLYNEYKEVVKNLGEIEKAYFTTFNLDISFVEKYLIPPLLKDDDIADNKLSLEDLNISLMKNKPDIKFFYDTNMLTSFDKKTLVETYPILINNGVFHPKVIYLKGSNASYLFIGSGNLTVSGWGRNIEAFEIVEILNKGHLEKQVLNFFDDVFELAGIERTNKTLRKILPHKHNFVYSFHKNCQSSSPLLEALNLDKSLQLFSPYFSDDLDQLFQKEQFDTLNEINIIPDLIENQKIRLKKLPTIMKEKIKFYRFKENKYFENNQDSTNHSKIWISDTHYAIGSHNCTEQALYGKNFEASLVQRYTNKEDFSLNSFAVVDNLDTSEKDESIEEELDDGDKFTSLYKLTANYKDYTFELDDISENVKINKIYIKLPSLQEKMLTHLELDDLEYSKRVQIFRALSKNKFFEIHNDNSLIFRGIIIEKNATKNTRLVDCAETLDDIFLSFADEKNPTEAKHLENRVVDVDREDENIYKRKNKETNVNYFTMFTGFKNLRNKYEEIKNDNEKLDRFCFSSPSSLSVVKNIIEEKVTQENLFIYLTILEFNKLVSKQKIKIKIKKIIEPKITLNKKDKNFIERMMK